MTFTRTPAGVANYRQFFHAAIMVFTEGTPEGAASSHSPSNDAVFYEALLTAASGGRAVKVKCVGNKSDALRYAAIISASNTAGAMVVVDKDDSGILYSAVPHPKVAYTYGYSWENDFLDLRGLGIVLATLTNGDAGGQRSLSDKYTNLVRRLHRISALDLASHVNGKVVIHKNGRSCGIQFDWKSKWCIKHQEIARLIRIYKQRVSDSLPIASTILRFASRQDAMKVIQGHLWENAALHLISHIYRTVTRDTMPSHHLLKKLALSELKKDPAGFVRTVVFDYYVRQIARCVT